MLSVMERLDLLDEVLDLVKARRFAAVVAALEGVPADVVLGEPELAHSLAQAYSHTDQRSKADLLLRDLAEACAFRGNDRLYRRRLNLQAVARIRRGELREAEALLREVQIASEAAGDRTFEATASMNLGVVADIRCDWNVARAYYQYAVVLFQSLGDQASIAGCYHNLAMLFRQGGNLREAEAYLDRATELQKPTGTKEERISTDIERSLLAVDLGDAARAYAIAEHSHRTAKGIGNERLTAEAQRAVGVASAACMRYEEANHYFAEALRLATEQENELLVAEVLEELAVLCKALNHDAEASRHLVRCAQIYKRLGSPGRADRAARRLETA